MPNIYVFTELVADGHGASATAEPSRWDLGGAGRFAASGAVKALKAAHADDHNKVFLMGKISEDKFGSDFRALLLSEGVDLSYARKSSRPSMQARVFPVDGGNDYEFPEPDPAGKNLSLQDFPKLGNAADQIDPKGSLFIFGSVFAVLQPVGATLIEYAKEVREKGGIVLFDLNAREKALPVSDSGERNWEFYRETVSKWAKIAHIMKASDEDIKRGFPTSSNQGKMLEWVKSADLALVTLGEHGAMACNKSGDIYSVPGLILSNIRHTVGAGDNWLAGAAVHILSVEQKSSHEWVNNPISILEAGTATACRHLIPQNPGSEFLAAISGVRNDILTRRPTLSP